MVHDAGARDLSCHRASHAGLSSLVFSYAPNYTGLRVAKSQNTANDSAMLLTTSLLYCKRRHYRVGGAVLLVLWLCLAVVPCAVAMQTAAMVDHGGSSGQHCPSEHDTQIQIRLCTDADATELLRPFGIEWFTGFAPPAGLAGADASRYTDQAAFATPSASIRAGPRIHLLHVQFRE